VIAIAAQRATGVGCRITLERRRGAHPGRRFMNAARRQVATISPR
jgi:hypothetical protein